MKRLWKHLAVYALMVLSTGLCGPAPAARQNDEGIRFLWAFGAMIGPQGDHQLVAVEQDQELRTGDRIKFFIQARNRCFIYLFHRSTQGQMALLFPRDLAQAPPAPEYCHLIPEGQLWFELDDQTGLETFYLVASTQRLRRLETLAAQHATLKAPERLEASAKAIRAEIKALRRAHRSLKVAAERPVRLGGTFRGSTQTERSDLPDIRQIAVEISAGHFYSRTFRIDHR